MHKDNRKYLINSAWMASELGLKFINGFFVTILIARFLGPESFGMLSYAISIMSVVIVIAKLGMDGVLVRDLTQYPNDDQSYMGTAFSLMMMGSVLLYSLLGLFLFIFESDSTLRDMVLLLSMAIFFQPLLVLDYFFQSRINAKYSTIAKALALLFSTAIKLILLMYEVELIYFVAAFLLDYVLIGIFLIVMYAIYGNRRFAFTVNSSIAKALLSSAWPMILSGLAVILYMRVDQLMIKSILGVQSLGLYSAATKIYEGWIMLPYVLSLSLLPVIIAIKKKSAQEFRRKFTKLVSIFFWTSVIVAIITTLFRDSIIVISFGSEFSQSSMTLLIIMWGAPFIALGNITARYFISEQLEKKIMLRTGVGLMLNVSLNYLLIPNFGIEGAAIATVVSLFVSNYLINYFDKDLLEIRQLINQAIALRT